MLRSSNLIIAGVVVMFCVSAALATPVVDGTVTGSEYDIVVNDAAGENGYDFYNSGLNIDTMQFDDDGGHTIGGSAYLAVTVVGPLPTPMFDTDGDPTSFLGVTDMVVMFYSDDDGDIPSYYLEICIRGTDIDVELYNYATSTYYDSLVEGVDYDISIVSALELRLSDNIFNTEDAGSFRAQLDGTGSWDDDQMDHNLIPEPMTLTLLGIGGIGALIRRRRK